MNQQWEMLQRIFGYSILLINMMYWGDFFLRVHTNSNTWVDMAILILIYFHIGFDWSIFRALLGHNCYFNMRPNDVFGPVLVGHSLCFWGSLWDLLWTLEDFLYVNLVKIHKIRWYLLFQWLETLSFFSSIIWRVQSVQIHDIWVQLSSRFPKETKQ